MAELVVLDLGRRAYGPTLELQERLVERVLEAEAERAYLVLVEHDPPVVTMGRSRGEEHIVAGPEKFAQLGVEVHQTSRGGDVTYHGPGQIVGYPILRVDRHGRDVHRYFRDLEEAILRTLAHFGIAAGRQEGLTGVWVGREKVAAMGIALRRWVSYHGFALNVDTDLSHFDLIVPCGITGRSVTSMSALLGRRVAVDDVKPTLIQCLVEVLGFDRARPGTEHERE